MRRRAKSTAERRPARGGRGRWPGRLLAGLLLGMAAGAFAADAPAVPSSPLAPLTFLIGGVWQGTLPASPDDRPVMLESHYEWAPDHQAIRFDSTWVVGGQRHAYSSGMYAWDPAKKQIVLWYTDSAGSLAQGVVTTVDGGFQQELTVVDASGITESVRARFQLQGPGHYQNDIFTLKAGQWEKLVTVPYQRTKPVPVPP